MGTDGSPAVAEKSLARRQTGTMVTAACSELGRDVSVSGRGLSVMPRAVTSSSNATDVVEAGRCSWTWLGGSRARHCGGAARRRGWWGRQVGVLGLLLAAVTTRTRARRGDHGEDVDRGVVVSLASRGQRRGTARRSWPRSSAYAARSGTRRARCRARLEGEVEAVDAACSSASLP